MRNANGATTSARDEEPIPLKFADYKRFDDLFGASSIFTSGTPAQRKRETESYVKDAMERRLYGYVHRLYMHGTPIERVAVGKPCEEEDTIGADVNACVAAADARAEARAPSEAFGSVPASGGGRTGAGGVVARASVDDSRARAPGAPKVIFGPGHKGWNDDEGGLSDAMRHLEPRKPTPAPDGGFVEPAQHATQQQQQQQQQQQRGADLVPAGFAGASFTPLPAMRAQGFVAAQEDEFTAGRDRFEEIEVRVVDRARPGPARGGAASSSDRAFRPFVAQICPSRKIEFSQLSLSLSPSRSPPLPPPPPPPSSTNRSACGSSSRASR